MESSAPEQTELLEEQRNILRVMRRSHRFLMGHIFSAVFGMYSVMLWVIFLVAMIGLPPTMLSIAGIIIIIPIIIAPLQYKSAKKRFGMLQGAGIALEDIETSLGTAQVLPGLTSYIFLIFDILRPSPQKRVTESDNEVENLRAQFSGLTRKILSEVIFQAVLFYFLITNFLIPELVTAIAEGSIFVLPLVFLIFVLIILIARWFIFFYWYFLARKWLRFYQGFMDWGQELEKTFFKTPDTTNGGLSP